MSRPSRPGASPPDRRRLHADLTKQRKYEVLARGPYFTPIVELAGAYVAAAIDDPAGTEAVFWALSCLPGTTPRRLSALTMRITDILVIYRAGPVVKTPARNAPVDKTPVGKTPVGKVAVDALMIVERSTLESGFGSRAAARRRFPRLRFTDSEYHGAGLDQMMISGPYDQMVRALRDERVAEAAREMARWMMRCGRVMHWRGHNPLLADHVLGRA